MRSRLGTKGVDNESVSQISNANEPIGNLMNQINSND